MKNLNVIVPYTQFEYCNKVDRLQVNLDNSNVTVVQSMNVEKDLSSRIQMTIDMKIISHSDTLEEYNFEKIFYKDFQYYTSRFELFTGVIYPKTLPTNMGLSNTQNLFELIDSNLLRVSLIPKGLYFYQNLSSFGNMQNAFNSLESDLDILKFYDSLYLRRLFPIKEIDPITVEFLWMEEFLLALQASPEQVSKLREIR